MNLIFLRKFTKELILNSKKDAKKEKIIYAPQILQIENQIPNIESIMYSEIKKLEKSPDTEKEDEKLKKPIIRKRIMLPKIFQKPTAKATPSQMTSSIMYQQSPATSAKPAQPQKEIQKEAISQGIIKPVRVEVSKIPPYHLHEEMPTPAYTSQEALDIDLGKLNYIIKDAKVTKIECKGPGRKILVMKMGQVNLTETVLSEEEIMEIIKIFSEKTRIPLIGGTFKAAYKNILIIAIISEYAGSRFIIEKKSAYSFIHAQNQTRRD